MIIEAEGNQYKLIKNYRDGFDKETFLNKYTSYYKDYDYIVGDIAYSKLRLKGFNNKNNRNFNKFNNYCNLEKYLKENCAYECRYFVLEKVSQEEK